MPISLDPKTDTLPIPAKDYKAFYAEIVQTYNKEKLKQLNVEKEEDVVKNLQTLNQHAQKLKDDGYPVLFHYDWNKQFKGSEESKKLFAELQKKELKELEGKARAILQGKKRFAANLATAAKAANDETDKILQAFQVLNKTVEEAEKPAAPAAPAGTPAPAPTPAPAVTTESILKQQILDKKLFENKLIDRSEYLVSLVRTKNLLKEAATPVAPSPVATTPAATPTTAPAAQPAAATTVDPKVARTEFGSLISSVASPKEETYFKKYMENINYLQDIGTKQSQANINENARKLIKAFVKKRILEETTIVLEEENKKEYLNEFILGLAIAALAALAAWAGKKLGDMFKSGPAFVVPPDPRYRGRANDPDEDDAGLMSEEYYVDPSTGKAQNAQGKPGNPAAQLGLAAQYKAHFEDVKTKYAANVAELSKKLPACNYPQEQNTKIQQAIAALPTTIATADNLSKAIDEYVKH